MPETFFLAAYQSMAKWLKDKAILNPLHMKGTLDPNDHNYSKPIQKDSSIAIEVIDGIPPPPTSECTHMISDLVSTIDFTFDSMEVFTTNGFSVDIDLQRNYFPTPVMPPLYIASTVDV